MCVFWKNKNSIQNFLAAIPKSTGGAAHPTIEFPVQRCVRQLFGDQIQKGQDCYRSRRAQKMLENRKFPFYKFWKILKITLFKIVFYAKSNVPIFSFFLFFAMQEPVSVAMCPPQSIQTLARMWCWFWAPTTQWTRATRALNSHTKLVGWLVDTYLAQHWGNLFVEKTFCIFFQLMEISDCQMCHRYSILVLWIFVFKILLVANFNNCFFLFYFFVFFFCTPIILYGKLFVF